MPPPQNYNINLNFNMAALQAIEEEESVDSPNDELYIAYRPIENAVKTEVLHGCLDKKCERLLVKNRI